jgi:hypothetical protein
MLAQIGEKFGIEIPIFRPKELAGVVGICSPKCLDDFLMRYTINHNMAKVLNGEERVHKPFALLYPTGEDSSGLALYSLKPPEARESATEWCATAMIG